MKPFVLSASLLATSILVVAACGDSPADVASTGPGDGDAGPPTADASEAEGTLTLTVTGLPDGVKARVMLRGPAGEQEVDAPGAVRVRAGTYAATGKSTTGTDAIVPKLFAAAPSKEASVSAGGGATLEIAYAAVPTSGRLWMVAGDQLLAFPSAKLGATSTQSGQASTLSAAATATAFASDGSLWVAAAAQLRHYPASSLASEGAPMPDVTLAVPAATAQGVTTIGGLAVDGAGNVWYAATAEDVVRRVAKADLGASGTVTKYVTLGGLDKPTALAFDAAGNLWTLDGGERGVKRFSAANLAKDQGGPDHALMPFSAGADPKPLVHPSAMAFDKAGALWLADGGDLVRLAPSDLTQGEPRPAIHIEITSPIPKDRIAFDASGGLWLAFSVAADLQGTPLLPSFARYAPGQIATSSSEPIEPERVVSFPAPQGVEGAEQLVFFPSIAP